MIQQIKCPSCGRLAPWKDNPFRPFCSEACKGRDLGNWASERYRIPDKAGERSDEAPPKGEE